jgi:hypothetical protein
LSTIKFRFEPSAGVPVEFVILSRTLFVSRRTRASRAMCRDAFNKQPRDTLIARFARFLT